MPVHGNFFFISWWLLAVILLVALVGVGVGVLLLLIWRSRRRPRGFEVLPHAPRER